MSASKKEDNGVCFSLQKRVAQAFTDRYGSPPALGWFAPGRVEVLGNHTDYNEGFVLSAALEQGIVFMVRPAPSGATRGRLLAVDLNREVEFDVSRPAPIPSAGWANYTLGVLHFLSAYLARSPLAFDAAFGGNLPLGAGLSSSAALSVSSTLALAALYGVELPPIEAAKIAQQAENEFAGVRCGLLDQISGLFGAEGRLVFTDFRSLNARTVALPAGVEFLLCNTGVKHRLVESAYNQRRAACERAAAHFAARLSHPVRTLRDVTMIEWEQYRDGLDDETARRAAHVIGENERVQAAVQRLNAGDLGGFGALMSASHDSSRKLFENSCPELDFCVEAFLRAGALGARLSGGGFGGSAIALVETSRASFTAHEVGGAAESQFGHPVTVSEIRPAAGARRV